MKKKIYKSVNSLLWSSDKIGGRTAQTTGDRWTLL